MQRGIEAALFAQRGTEPATAQRSQRESEEIKTPALREVPMPQPYRLVEERLRALWWKTKGQTKEWRTVESLIDLLAPEAETPQVSRGAAKKAPAR